MNKLILILTVMLSVGCEKTFDNRLDKIEFEAKILRRQNCELKNYISEYQYETCVDIWKASEEVKHDSHEKKVRKEIERLRTLVNADMKSSIVVLPINDNGFIINSGSQCFKTPPQNCEEN